MMAMTVAFGTLTPTSMTVVATRTWTSLAEKARITASFSSGGMRPCRISMRRPRNGPWASMVATSITDRAGRLSSSSDFAGSSSPMRGQTKYAWWPFATSSRTLANARSSHAGFSRTGTTEVLIGERPPGSSRSAETSRSP